MLRLIPLECGRLNADSAGLISGTTGRIELPIASWVVQHPKGTLVFDTGMHPELQSDVSRIGRTADMFDFDYPAGEELSARLEGVDIDPAEVAVMVFSHLHFDHCGGATLLPNARVICQKAEWDAGHHPKLVEHRVYNPDDFDLGHDKLLVEGSHDVFGDGSVACVPTPGHTAGHQSLRVMLDSGPVVLTADCVYTRGQMDAMVTPPFGFDTELQHRSMAQLADMERAGDRLLFGHDIEQFRSLPAALT